MKQPESLNDDEQGHTDRTIKNLLRNARSLLGQMTSHNTFETASQVTALAGQAGSESRESLWDGMIGLIFRRATRDTINPLETTKLCAQLCGYLVQASGNPSLNLFPKEHWLGPKVSRLCLNSLPPSGDSEALGRNLASTMSKGVQRLQGSTRFDGASSEYPPAERTTSFVADLYGENVLTAPQVHEFVEHLIASGASMEERATGLCALIEQHGQTLNNGHWKDAMDSAFRWIDMAVGERLVGRDIATRLEEIMRLYPQNWEAVQTTEWVIKGEKENGESALKQTTTILLEAKAATEAYGIVSPAELSMPTSNTLPPSANPEPAFPLSLFATAPDATKCPISGPLELISAQGSGSARFPLALASARAIKDLNAVNYPETIVTPNPVLSFAVEPGRFRYDRDFMLQFMNVCKERPVSLPPLDAIGLEPSASGVMTGYPGGKRAAGRRAGLMGGTPDLQQQNPSALGLEGTSQRAVKGSGGPREQKRTRSQRGNNRNDSMRQSGSQASAMQMPPLEPVAPLQQTENRWVAESTQNVPHKIEARALVERKAKSLLNKLTMDKFDSISDQIIEYANQGENEKDGATLMQVTKLVFKKAIAEAMFSEMYARLCRRMVERISPSVQDKTIRDTNGQPLMGGVLFRKYLLYLCWEGSERGRANGEAAVLLASNPGDSKAARVAAHANGNIFLYSDECDIAAKAKRQEHNLVRFMGQLFKSQMLTERIMQECIKKLLSDTVNLEEEKIETLCKLLTMVGQGLDNAKGRNHMDIYFERIQEISRSNISLRMRFMLQDVIDLRARRWQARALRVPSASTVRHNSKQGDGGSRNTVQRGGSRRGEPRGEHGPKADEWNVAGGTSATRPPAKAGDLSQFGKISKPASTLSFGPSSVFKKNPKREASLSQAGSSTNMFSLVSQTPSVDVGLGGAPAVGKGSARKRLNLLPKPKPEAEAEVKVVL